MDAIYRWMLWVICSFVGTIILHNFIPNKVVFAFCVALVLGFVAVVDRD